jgi:hypothetical protein
MEHSKPDKPNAKQQKTDADISSHRVIINTDTCKVVCQKQPQQTNDDRHTTYERTNNRILAWILIVTSIYTVFSCLQWDIMRSSMKLEQRAWVGVNNISAIFEIGKPLDISIEFKNTGKTPARKLTVAGVLDPIEPDKIPDFEKKIL